MKTKGTARESRGRPARWPCAHLAQGPGGDDVVQELHREPAAQLNGLHVALAGPGERGEEEAHGEGVVQVPKGVDEGGVPAWPGGRRSGLVTCHPEGPTPKRGLATKGPGSTSLPWPWEEPGNQNCPLSSEDPRNPDGVPKNPLQTEDLDLDHFHMLWSKRAGQANGSLSQGGNFGSKEIYLEVQDRKQKNVALPGWATVEGGGHPAWGWRGCGENTSCCAPSTALPALALGWADSMKASPSSLS